MKMKMYEVNFTLAVQEFVEAENIEDAKQAFSELMTEGELLEYGELTVTETDWEVSDE